MTAASACSLLQGTMTTRSISSSETCLLGGGGELRLRQSLGEVGNGYWGLGSVGESHGCHALVNASSESKVDFLCCGGPLDPIWVDGGSLRQGKYPKVHDSMSSSSFAVPKEAFAGSPPTRPTAGYVPSCYLRYSSS